jgi:hypothetical protein
VADIEKFEELGGEFVDELLATVCVDLGRNPEF